MEGVRGRSVPGWAHHGAAKEFTELQCDCVLEVFAQALSYAVSEGSGPVRRSISSSGYSMNSEDRIGSDPSGKPQRSSGGKL